MKTLLFTAALLLVPLHVFSQIKIWEVSGYVRNESGEVLPGALVQTNDTTGVSTDQAGFFLLRQRERPTEIAVRRLGFFSRRVLIRAADFQQGTTRIEVSLSPQNTALEGVDIIGAKLTALAEENTTSHIYDYEFAGEHLLLLLRERKQYLIRLVTESGRVLHQLKLPAAFVRLHRSCTGGLHLVGRDAAQELIVSDFGLDTFPRYAVSRFEQLIEPCLLEFRGHYFYGRSEQMNQAVRYWYYDPDGQLHPFAYIRSEAGLRAAWRAYAAFLYNKTMMPRPSPEAPPPPPIDDDFLWIEDEPADRMPQLPRNIQQLALQAECSKQVAWLGVLQTVMADSVYAPLLVVGDTLLLFDHVNGTLKQFGRSFDRAETRRIVYQTAAGWQKELLKDLYGLAQMIFSRCSAPTLHISVRCTCQTYILINATNLSPLCGCANHLEF